MITTFFVLLFAHAMGDFAAQPEVMARGKSRHSKPDYVPPGQAFCLCWPYWLFAHALIHGGLVYFVTGSCLLGVLETVLHAVIDFAKCEGWTNVHQDQLWHLAAKVVYLALLGFVL
jgi:hypothetical protein